MYQVHTAIEAISLWMARIGGGLLIVASVIISVEIIGRKLFVIPFSIGTELSSYALAISASWSFAYALLHRAHVRIDVLRNLAGPRIRAILDMLALIALGALALLLVRYVWDTVEASWAFGARENTSLGTPLIIPQSMWFLGLLWFALVCIEQIMMAAIAFARGDLVGLAKIAAPNDVDEEIEEALATLEPGMNQIGKI